jgi:hypothetical protein
VSSIADCAAEILDRICDVVTGPVVGTISATCSLGRVRIPRGQMATLPDGRRVRVTHNTWVEGTDTVPVRLEHLAPSVPAANNFRATAAGTVATWVSPPASIDATGTTSVFASGARAGSMKIAALAEYDSPDAFPAGAQGTASLILVSPSLRSVAGPGMRSRALYEATWRLRLNVYDNAEQPVRRTRARDAFDAIDASIVGAFAGDDIIRIGSWVPIRDGIAWEATLLTRIVNDGRVLADADSGDDLEGVDLTVLLPEDADQPSPFRVQDSLDV